MQIGRQRFKRGLTYLLRTPALAAAFNRNMERAGRMVRLKPEPVGVRISASTPGYSRSNPREGRYARGLKAGRVWKLDQPRPACACCGVTRAHTWELWMLEGFRIVISSVPVNGHRLNRHDRVCDRCRMSLIDQKAIW